MLTTLTTVLLSTALLMQAIIDDPTTVPSKPDALAAIDRFLASPGPGDDAKVINRFAEESKDCLVSISPNVLPWVTRDPAYKYHGALLTAFIAGNVRSQLQSGKVEDDAYAGTLAVIQAYNKLRERDKDFTAPEIEKQIALEKTGELKAHIEKAAAEAKKEQNGR